MPSPDNSHDGRDDHDYHLPVVVADDASTDADEAPIHRRVNRSHENTDHDYLAVEEEIVDGNLDVENEIATIEIERVDTVDLVQSDADENTEYGNNGTQEANARETVAAERNNNDEVIINISSPSPPKKRKRLSLGKANANTPTDKTALTDDPDQEDDGLTCPICLDSWEMSGEHRLVSLKCGHLFGHSCIKRWLAESARQSGNKMCPQCKAKAVPRDIRFLYAKRLCAIDRSEEHRLRELLDEERQRSENLKIELASLRMSYTTATTKINSLEADNQRMKKLLRNGGGGYSFDSDTQLPIRLQSFKLFLEKNIEISKEPGCRVMIYADKQSSVIVSQKSSQSLFPGYGLRFIDAPTFRATNFLHSSTKMLRDISLSADQNQLTVASMESKTKLYDLRTWQHAAVFSPSDKLLWACALDRNERENFLYLGAQHGSTYVYDLRYPDNVMDEFKAEGDLSPVIGISPVPPSKHFAWGGFLVCKLQSLWFFEYSSSTSNATPYRLAVEGPFISMNFDAGHETLLVSARSNQIYQQSRYVLGKLEKINELPVFNVKVSFFGSKTTPVMTRCTQIPVEANTLIAGYIQDVKLLALFDARREQRLQSMPVQEIVYDTCPVFTSNATYLAALTEAKCRIYKLTPTS